MRSRLNAIKDWAERARAARYRVAALASTLGISSQGLRKYWLERFAICPKCWMEQLLAFDAIVLLAQGKPIKEPFV